MTRTKIIEIHCEHYSDEGAMTEIGALMRKVKQAVDDTNKICIHSKFVMCNCQRKKYETFEREK
jgi:hypothetical protein